MSAHTLAQATQAARPKLQRSPVHGVLLLDKPLGLSSNQALQKAKWLLAAEKAGHTGTLDPLATGLLPLCFGAATKFSQLHLDADKVYEATLRLGERTTTGDAEGEIIATAPVRCTRQQLQAACAAFVGEIEQIPPMHSALKKDGKALYEYARAGQTVERTPRRVRIHRIEVIHDNLPAQTVTLRVACSKGTYIRTLAEDLGQALGCGAHLTALRRTATGPFGIEAAITLEQLQALPAPERIAALAPTHTLLSSTHQRVDLTSDEAGRFLLGQRLRSPAASHAERVAVWGTQPSALLGTAHITAGVLIADRLLTPQEIAQTLSQPAPTIST